MARIDEVEGIGPAYAEKLAAAGVKTTDDLLEGAGVDSPAELAQRNAANLAGTIAELVAARPNIVRRAPGEATIQGWIDEAKTLGKTVTH